MPLVLAGVAAVVAYFAWQIRRTLTTAPEPRIVQFGVPFYGEGGNGVFLVVPTRTVLPPIAQPLTRAYAHAEDKYLIFIGPDAGFGGHWADDVRGQELAERARKYAEK